MNQNQRIGLERISTGAHLAWAAKLVLAFVVPCLVCLGAGVLLACAVVRSEDMGRREARAATTAATAVQ